MAELNSINNPSQVIYINEMKHESYFYKTYLLDKVEQKYFEQEYVRFMRQLKVKPHLLSKIDEFTQKFMFNDGVLGMNIRRTDHLVYIKNYNLASNFSSDEKIISAIKQKILSKCKQIIGSYGSSFSQYAGKLGGISVIYP